MGVQTKGTERSFWLDVLRVLLCTGVLIYHYTPERPSSGPMCVDGFIVLSGFLLAAGFERMADKGGMDVLAFYGGKARRLLPTLCASLLLGFLYLATAGEPLLPEWAEDGFRLTTFVEHYNTPAWYMVSELAFLGLAPLLFLAYKTGWKPVAFLLLLAAGYSAWLYSEMPFAAPFGGGLYFQPRVRLWQFTAGVLAWMLMAHPPLRPWMKKTTWSLFAFTILLLAVLCVVKQYTTLQSLNYTWYFDAAMVLLFMALIPGLSQLPAPESTRLRKHLTYAAALTYPVYLYHVPLQWWFIDLFGKQWLPWIDPVYTGLLSIAATLALSALSLKYWDGFFSRKKRRAPAII